MGKKFESPAIVSLSLEDTEGLFATKGSGEKPPKDDVRVELTYKDHNSGSLSVVEFAIYNEGTEDKWNFKIFCELLNGLELDPDYDHICSGYPVHKLSPTLFWVEWHNKVEPFKDPARINLQTRVIGGPTRDGHKGAMDTDTSAHVAIKVYYVES